MLTIKEISITNFRSIRSERFELRALTILVGKNDVGKSNLLEAIRVLFEGTAASVDAEDFYDPSSPMEIVAVLAGIRDYLPLCDERNRPKLEQRIDTDGLLTIRRIAASPRKLGPIEVRDPETEEFGTPTGIDAAMKPVLPEVIFIEALADVAEEAKGTQKDALGQLVGQVMTSIADQVQPRLDQAYAEANRLLNVQRDPATGNEQDERAAELAAIERDVSRHLQETFPRASVRLKVKLPSVKSILGQIDVTVREGAHEDPYYRRGHGIQRTLYLSLLRALATRIRDRTLDYLRDYIIFRAVKDLLKLEKYTSVNNVLWFAAIKDEETGPEEVIKSYGSISMENDLRDFLAENLFVVEKGLSLIGKEYDTRDAGRIDLLCKDKSGFHVVIELKKGRVGHEVVGQALKYIGWVQKNLNKKARGIIIVNEPDDKLLYAALPLHNLMQVKYYKVHFAISDTHPVK